MNNSFNTKKLDFSNDYELTNEDVIFKSDDTISFFEFLNGDGYETEEEF